MTELLSGADNGPLAGWVIAQTNGLTLIGRVDGDYVRKAIGGLKDNPFVMSPVLHMQPNLVQGQGGGMAPIQPCFPVFLCDVRDVTVPSGALVVECESLSKAQRAQLWKFVEQGLAILEQLRLASSGIVAARTIPKLVTKQ